MNLSPPPPAEMAVLYDLVMRGNMRRVGEWAAHLEESNQGYSSFANKVGQLAEGFESKALQTLVKAYKQNES